MTNSKRLGLPNHPQEKAIEQVVASQGCNTHVEEDACQQLYSFILMPWVWPAVAVTTKTFYVLTSLLGDLSEPSLSTVTASGAKHKNRQ